MTLREVFDELAGGGDADPAEALADRGYGELPDPLLSEAIVSYADTAPVEVAEHLAPFVMVHSAVPVDLSPDAPAGDGLGLLATAPEAIMPDPTDLEPTEATPPESGDLSYEDDLDLEFEFGHGAEAVEGWAGGTETAEIAETAVAAGDSETTDDIADFEPAAGSWFPAPETAAADQDEPAGGDAGG